MANQQSTHNSDYAPVTAAFFKNFAEDHRETLEYLSKYGSSIEKAKVSIIIKLGSGSL